MKKNQKLPSETTRSGAKYYVISLIIIPKKKFGLWTAKMRHTEIVETEKRNATKILGKPRGIQTQRELVIFLQEIKL